MSQEQRAQPGRAPRPIAVAIVRLWLVLLTAFAVLAAGAGYWQVAQAQDLVNRADDPLLVAAARHTARGKILDRDGTVLASSRAGPNGEPYRVYASRALAPVLGYASSVYGTSGLEQAFDAALSGVSSADPVDALLAKFRRDRFHPEDLTLSLSLPLQQAAVRLLGPNRGAVVMLDPRSGEVLVLASTPTFDASGIANPSTARAAFGAAAADPGQPLVDRATQGLYVPGSVFKIVTAVAALGSGAITPSTRYAQQPAAETTGLLVSGFRVHDGHHLFTGSEELDFARAVEVSCNIYFALAGLATGGAEMTAWADRLGFGAPIPFDLPTAASQVTGGGGSFGGGFRDDVELANAAYGQAETLVTPLQMALVAATVANDGVLMRPHLVIRRSGAGGVTLVAPEVWRQVISPDVAHQIEAAMLQAVEGPDGRQFTAGAAVPGIPVAGKSGTAQLDGSAQPHSWFIGFAPATQPQIAIAVIVEQGGDATRASPIAGQLLAQYFALARP